MKHKAIHIALIAVASMVMSGMATAGGKETTKPDVGRIEYMNSCAVCHGADGKAQTQVMDILKVAPPDLRVLAKSNGGVFPIGRIYETIDGRFLVKSHGSRDMPMWGQRYVAEASPYYDDFAYNAEVSARARILSLIDYIYRLQEK